MIRENIWLIYFLIYSLINLLICMIFFILNIFYINQIFFSNIKLIIKLTIIFNLLSLGGLPPFLGFFPKWIIINYLIINKFFILTFIFIIIRLIILFFYIRITYSSFILNYIKLKWFKIKIKNSFFSLFNIIYIFSILGLPLRTLLFYF